MRTWQSAKMNRHLRTVVIAPMTARRRDTPSRVDVTFQRKRGQAVLDQVHSVDKSRLVRRLGRLPETRARQVSGVLVEVFAYG